MDLEEKLYREGFRISSFKTRVLSYLIDESFVLLLLIAIFYNQFLESNGKLVIIVEVLDNFLIAYFIIKLIYHTIFIYFYGKTMGKLIMRIRVVDIYLLDNPSLKNSFIRAVLRFLDESFFYVGMFYLFANPFKQTIHDKLSDVVVVDD